MIRQIVRFAVAAALAGGATVGLAAESWADDCDFGDGRYHFDFGDSAYPDCFRDVLPLPPHAFARGMDLGDRNHTALNITGSAGAAGATWLTVVDQAPGGSGEDNRFGSGYVCADILFQRFDNIKGAGVVTFFNQVDQAGNVVDKKGLALILYNAGNTDRLVLATVEGLVAKAGKVAVVESLSLGGLIQENAWYRVLLTAQVDEPGPPKITGQVFTHAEAKNPNSSIYRVDLSRRGAPPRFATVSHDSLPDPVTPPGQNGIIGSAFNAVVNASVTNFSNKLEDCCDGLPVEDCLGRSETPN